MTQLQDRVDFGSPADDYKHIAVRKVGGVIGAVVEGCARTATWNRPRSRSCAPPC